MVATAFSSQEGGVTLRENTELKIAIENVLSKTNESEDYKKRLKKLIENFIDNSYSDDDIYNVLTLAQISEEGESL
jgi:ABC-type amino acid transport substrate-binding protein